jgi:peptidoglycan hydrolase-like amidase
MLLKMLLVVGVFILVAGSLGCESPVTTTTPESTATKTVSITETETTTATDTVTITETATETKTILETQTVTTTATIAHTPIRVKRVRHGNGQIVTLDMEAEYLPVVVACENPKAPYESLKAQAIASRTFAYYKILHEPRSDTYDILDYEADQVYDPAALSILTEEELDRIYQAVEETRALVIRHEGIIICAFYVSGATHMLQYVTINEGKSGDDVIQTILDAGYSAPTRNPYNRGCMGQIQANELALQSYDYERILKYFYGSDIYIQHI